MPVMCSSPERTVSPYVGLTILLWVINKSLMAKPTNSSDNGPWPTTVFVLKKKKKKTGSLDHIYVILVVPSGCLRAAACRPLLDEPGDASKIVETHQLII